MEKVPNECRFNAKRLARQRPAPPGKADASAGSRAMLKLALIDDYAHVALESADWSQLAGKAEIAVFDRHLTEDEAAEALAPFDAICTIRERMAFPRSLIARLPNLKLITIVGARLTNL